ncbi:MAG: tRNA (guanosine(37)-N1)-methyltransferase TrmD [Bernardetiaceae bacterium]|nr:tRNA (guanosine(37)-N1)-methyltransferase TrmD [Bernardetiaceae bacterium]
MRVDIISALPQLMDSFLNQSILQRAQDKGVAHIALHNLRDYSLDKHKRIDDESYGGSAGMVLSLEPFARCINSLKAKRDYQEVIFMTPDGKRFDQPTANALSLHQNLMILCGHYKGIDERIREHFVTLELSIGDFVVSGGEIPAALVTDAIVRLVPGVLHDETSALSDSFQDGLLAPPVYTRPADYEGMKVPDILLSGHEAKIEDWRMEQALQRTKARRPDLYKKYIQIE